MSTEVDTSFVDHFIGNHFEGQPSIQFRARILVHAWLLFSGTLLVLGLTSAALPMQLEARISGMVLCFVIAIFLIGLTLTFKKSGNYRLYGHLSVGLAFVGLSVSVVLAEMVISSPSLGLFYIIPVIAVFFLGKRSGWLWCFFTLVVLSILMSVESLGYTAFSLYDDSFLLETRLSTVVMGMVGILGMVLTYEASNKKLRQARDFEYARLEFLAHNDQLTGMLNRASFEEKIEGSISQLGLVQKNERLALLYLDLDGFKPVNDIYGHKAGDEVLRSVSKTIKNSILEKGYAARHGGDEFIILLEHIQSVDEAMEFSERLLTSISQPVSYEGNELVVTASIGVAFFPKDAQDIPTLLKHADIAMYQAKEQKNGCVRFKADE